MATEIKKKKVSVLTILFWLYAIIVIGYTLFGPSPDKYRFIHHHSNARPKACHSNCRVIMGGIEMYNMDHNEDYESIEIPLDPSNCVLKGYYKPILKPDSDCLYKYDVDNSVVYCTLHGDYDGYPPGTTKAERERLKAESRKGAKIEPIRKYIQEIPERFLYGLVSPLILILKITGNSSIL